MNNRVRILKISEAALRHALGLPSDTVVVNARASFDQVGMLEVVISHPDFEPIETGLLVPTVDAVYDASAFKGWAPR